MTDDDKAAVTRMEDDPYTIILSKEEVLQSSLCGVRRHIESLSSGRKDTAEAEKERGWSYHVEGAAGEQAFAKFMGRYWGGDVCTFKGPDVHKAQVRTRSQDRYDLILRPGDSPDDWYVLVTGMSPTFRIRGWIWGREGMQDKYWRRPNSRPAAWFIPASDLRSFPAKFTLRLEPA